MLYFLYETHYVCFHGHKSKLEGYSDNKRLGLIELLPSLPKILTYSVVSCSHGRKIIAGQMKPSPLSHNITYIFFYVFISLAKGPVSSFYNAIEIF